MVFSSVVFIFRFLPIFMMLYFMAPKRMRNLILFLGSLFFYAWGEPVYVLLMLFSTVSDYFHGIWIDNSLDRERKGLAKVFLTSSLIINIGMLCFFKYTGLVALPIGISFYTFQTMSYTIDCYRRRVKVQTNILDFGVFVAMFPQLIAGPIVKYSDVAESLSEREIGILDVAYGFRRFVYGLAKKVLLANNFGLIWREISSTQSEELTVLGAWIGMVAFAFQIYFDFSGYSDMAIGLGASLGFRFPENFNYPYIATSITEFWRRWHMTLSGWFKEYVYIPLGGNKKGIKRQLFSITIVWILTGIWHGAGWNFLLWGAWFAFWLMIEKFVLRDFLSMLPKILTRIYTLLLVLISWVFFSIEQGSGILNYLKAMFGVEAGFSNAETVFLYTENWMLLLIGVIASTPILKKIGRRLEKSETGYGKGIYGIMDKLFLGILFIISIAYVVEASYNPFLYFRF